MLFDEDFASPPFNLTQDYDFSLGWTSNSSTSRQRRTKIANVKAFESILSAGVKVSNCRYKAFLKTDTHPECRSKMGC